MPKNREQGFVPIIALFVVALIGILTVVIVRDTTLGPKPLDTETESTNTPEQTATPSASASVKTTIKASPSTTPKPPTSSSPSPSSSSSNNTAASSSPIASTSPPTSPSPSPTQKSYTWTGTNINVTTKCYTGDPTFDIEVSGSNLIAGSGNGVWTTLTGDGSTIIVSYDQGNGSSPINVSYNFNDQVPSIRSGSPISLQTSVPNVIGYEIKAYAAPETFGTPTLSNQIGNASFATDCK